MAYTGNSIVDYLKSVGQASDYSSRANLAQQKGITNYVGSADQNTQLLNILRGSGAPATPTPTPTPTPTTPTNTQTPPGQTPNNQSNPANAGWQSSPFESGAVPNTPVQSAPMANNNPAFTPTYRANALTDSGQVVTITAKTQTELNAELAKNGWTLASEIIASHPESYVRDESTGQMIPVGKMVFDPTTPQKTATLTSPDGSFKTVVLSGSEQASKLMTAGWTLGNAGRQTQSLSQALSTLPGGAPTSQGGTEDLSNNQGVKDLISSGASWSDIQKYLESQATGQKTTQQLTDEVYAKYGLTGLETNAFAPITENYETIYKRLYTDYGGDGVKTQMDAVNAKITKANEDYTTALGGINDNPWISESGRVGKIKKLTDAYNATYQNLQSEYTRLSNDYQRIDERAKNVASNVLAELEKNQQLNQQQLDYYSKRAQADLEVALKQQTENTEKEFMRYFPEVAKQLADAEKAATTKTETQKQLITLMTKYPDAGITLNDTLESATAKVKNSLVFAKETYYKGSSNNNTPVNNPTVQNSEWATIAGLNGKTYDQANQVLSGGPTSEFLRNLSLKDNKSYLATSAYAIQKWNEAKNAIQSTMKKSTTTSTFKPSAADLSKAKQWLVKQPDYDPSDLDQLTSNQEFFYWVLGQANTKATDPYASVLNQSAQ